MIHVENIALPMPVECHHCILDVGSSWYFLIPIQACVRCAASVEEVALRLNHGYLLLQKHFAGRVGDPDIERTQERRPHRWCTGDVAIMAQILETQMSKEATHSDICNAETSLELAPNCPSLNLRLRGHRGSWFARIVGDV